MKRLVDITFDRFYEINEFVARTSPMHTHYYSGNPLERFIWQTKLQKMDSLLRKIPYDKVLDVGCGDGRIVSLLRPECEYTGIDISPTQLSYLKNNCPIFAVIIKEKLFSNKPMPYLYHFLLLLSI